MPEHAVWLRDRAESYWRDSLVFDPDDQEEAAMRVAYRTIATELRFCADMVDKEPEEVPDGS